jgi:16S rRNA (uracil1498-N3)-methyltransferase
MNLFFNPKISQETESFIFSSEESKHVYKVLRKIEGDNITVTNGNGLKWSGKLIEVGNKNTEAIKIKSEIIEDNRFDLEIAISPPKSNHRNEWFIEKATEIGIKKIHFIKTENSERKKINLSRFQKVAISSIKQSKQFYVPEIKEIVTFSDFLKNNDFKNKLIAHCENSNKKHIANISLENKPIIVLIGPEGDFSKNEITQANINNYESISLGNNILRTETAAIYVTQAISVLSCLQKK